VEIVSLGAAGSVRRRIGAADARGLKLELKTSPRFSFGPEGELRRGDIVEIEALDAPLRLRGSANTSTLRVLPGVYRLVCRGVDGVRTLNVTLEPGVEFVLPPREDWALSNE